MTHCSFITFLFSSWYSSILSNTDILAGGLLIAEQYSCTSSADVKNSTNLAAASWFFEPEVIPKHQSPDGETTLLVSENLG